VHVSRSLLFFPCTNVPYVNIHTEHISIYPVLSATEAITKLFPHCSHLTNIHSTVSPAVSVATPQSLWSQNNSVIHMFPRSAQSEFQEGSNSIATLSCSVTIYR